MFHELHDDRRSFFNERAELEPVLSADEFVFLDDTGRLFLAATFKGVWWLYYPSGRDSWKRFRPLSWTELTRAQRRALPRDMEASGGRLPMG
ncbi:MAG TPA: hypothetical protein VH092_22405 [Urbifossiella sp.]|nr:hypothetical protein [Urbifossiella sp.]